MDINICSMAQRNFSLNALRQLWMSSAGGLGYPLQSPVKNLGVLSVIFKDHVKQLCFAMYWLLCGLRSQTLAPVRSWNFVHFHSSIISWLKCRYQKLSWGCQTIFLEANLTEQSVVCPRERLLSAVVGCELSGVCKSSKRERENREGG